MKNLKKVLALVLAVVMIMGVVSVASAKTYKDASARIQIGMEKKIRSDFAAQLSAYLNSIPVE